MLHKISTSILTTGLVLVLLSMLALLVLMTTFDLYNHYFLQLGIMEKLKTKIFIGDHITALAGIGIVVVAIGAVVKVIAIAKE
jgi:hypothetical protein